MRFIKNNFLITIIVLIFPSCSVIELSKSCRPTDKLKWHDDKATRKSSRTEYYAACIQNNHLMGDSSFIGIVTDDFSDQRALFFGPPYLPIPIFPAFLFSFFRKDTSDFVCGILIRNYSDTSELDLNKIKIIVNNNPDFVPQINLQRINFYSLDNYNSDTGEWIDSLGYNNTFYEVKLNISRKKVKSVSIDFNDSSIVDFPIDLVKKPKLLYTPFMFSH